MYATRSSKRQAGLQDKANLPLVTTGVTSKSNTKHKVPVNDRTTVRSTRHLDRLCKQPSGKSACKDPITLQIKCNAKKEKSDLKVLKPDSTHTLKQPLISRNNVRSHSQKLNNQENVGNKVTKVKKSCNLNSSITLDKENYPARVTISLKNPSKSVSENACQRKPVWAPENNAPLKNGRKRSRISDVYDIDRDEDLMTDNPFKKKKVNNKKTKIIKSKECYKKPNLPFSNDNKITSMFISKPAVKLKVCKAMVPTNACNVQTHLIKTLDAANVVETKTLSKMMHHEQSETNQDSNLKDIAINTCSIQALPNETPDAANASRTKGVKKMMHHKQSETSQDSILVLNDLDLSSEPIICSEQLSVGKTNIETHVTVGEDVLNNEGTRGKVKKDIEDCINECISSFNNLDTSMAAVCCNNEEYLVNSSDGTPIKQTYDVNKKTNGFLHDLDDGGPFFLVPKMTSTPESEAHPVMEIANPCQNTFGKQLPEISSVPCSASRNIQFDSFDSDFLSPEKSRSDALLVSPFKEEKIKVIPEDISPIKKVNSHSDSQGLQGKRTRSKRTTPKDKSESVDLSSKLITKACDMDIHEYTLFDSPVKKRRVRKKVAVPSPGKSKNVKLNFIEESYPEIKVLSPRNHQPRKLLLTEEEPVPEFKVLEPRVSYHSPHQFRKRLIPKVKEHEKKTKTKTKADKMAEDMNRHFSDLENTALCIE